MTNTEALAPTFDQLIKFALMSAQAVHDTRIAECEAAVAIGDFSYVARNQIEYGVKSQYRLRALTIGAEHGPEALAQIIAEGFNASPSWTSAFANGEAIARQEVARALLKEWRQFIPVDELVDRIYS